MGRLENVTGSYAWHTMAVHLPQQPRGVLVSVASFFFVVSLVGTLSDPGLLKL